MTRFIPMLPFLALGALACTPEGDDSDTGMTSDDWEFATDAPTAYTRADRMGMPAIATAVILSKDAYNADDPSDDATLKWAGEIIASLEVLHGALDDDLTSLALTPCAGSATHAEVGECVDQAAPLVIPDTLTLDLSAASGFPNGRMLEDPVIDVTLAVILLDLGTHSAATFAGLPLNPPANDALFGTAFPYLADPH